MTTATQGPPQVATSAGITWETVDGAGGVDDSVTDSVTDAVLVATSHLADTVRAAFIASLDGSISLAQFELLAALRDLGPMKLTTLADHLGVNPSTSNRMVNRLIEAGLVNRRINPTVRREVVLEVTDAGAATLRTVSQRRRSTLTGIVAHMSEQSRYHLVDALRAFTEAGGGPVDARTAAPFGSGPGRRRDLRRES